MAELINRRTTRKTIEKYFESLAPSHYYKMDLEKASAYLVSEISELPTVTEAEIRAKAIEEFAEKLKEAFFVLGKYDGHEIKVKIDYMAEQLKGEQ